MIASYEHFLGLASRLQWDDAAIDLSADAAPDERVARAPRRLLRGRGGRRRAPARLLRRPRRSVLRGAAARRGAPRAVLRSLRAERRARRPARARVATSSRSCSRCGCRRRPRAPGRRPSAVYHMVLEGVVFTAGQLALLEHPRRSAARASGRAPSSCCATSAGTSASALAACSTPGSRRRPRPRSSTRASARRRCGRRSRRSGVDGDAAPPAEGRAVKLETEEMPGAEPALVFLHEGLGSVALWRDFPGRLAEATGRRALIYSRAGHGQSDVPDVPRTAALHARRGARRAPAAARFARHRAADPGRPQRRRLDRAHPRQRAPRVRPRAARAARLRRGCVGGQHRRGARDVRDDRPRRAHGPLPPRRRGHVPALERHLARAGVPRLEHRGRAAAA